MEEKMVVSRKTKLNVLERLPGDNMVLKKNTINSDVSENPLKDYEENKPQIYKDSHNILLMFYDLFPFYRNQF